MPGAVDLQVHLRTLPPFIRRLFVVYFGFIGLILIGFGSLTFFYARVLAGGEPLGWAFCLLCTVFWAVRLIVAAFVLDVRPYLTTRLYRIGYWALNVVFIYLLVVYATALLAGGAK